MHVHTQVHTRGEVHASRRRRPEEKNADFWGVTEIEAGSPISLPATEIGWLAPGRRFLSPHLHGHEPSGSGRGVRMQ